MSYLNDLLTGIFGEVQANPTANTMLGRLKALAAQAPAALGANGGMKVEGVAGGVAQPVTPGATELHLGQMGGHTLCVDATPVLTVHATYVANDYVGTSGVAITFAGAAREPGGTGVIFGASLIDAALQSLAGELWLFDAEPTPPDDSAAWTISDADAARCIGVISFATYFASALNAVAPVGNLTIGFKCAAGSKDIYGCFVTRGAPAYASGDLTIRLRISQD